MNTFSDFIFSNRLEAELQWLLDNPDKVPNVLCLYGYPGIGKTSFARFLVNQLCSTITYHDFSGKDVGNSFFKDFTRMCSTCGVDQLDNYGTFSRGLVLDEFHDLSPRTQDRFKVTLERFDNCLFVICLNTTHTKGINKTLSSAIRSRTHLIDFTLDKSEAIEVASKVSTKYPHLPYSQIFKWLPDMRLITREAMMKA